jgi:hypothetical protein
MVYTRGIMGFSEAPSGLSAGTIFDPYNPTR